MEDAGGGYLKILDEMRELHVRKSADYGADGDPLANYRACREVGVEPWRGCVIRMLDKIQRLKTFMLKGKLENEGVEDTFKDIAAHSLIALTLFREVNWGGNDADHPEEAGMEQPKSLVLAMAERIAAQSEILSKRAEK